MFKNVLHDGNDLKWWSQVNQCSMWSLYGRKTIVSVESRFTNCANAHMRSEVNKHLNIKWSDNGVEEDDAAMCITNQNKQSIYYFMTPRYLDHMDVLHDETQGNKVWGTHSAFFSKWFEIASSVYALHFVVWNDVGTGDTGALIFLNALSLRELLIPWSWRISEVLFCSIVWF